MSSEDPFSGAAEGVEPAPPGAPSPSDVADKNTLTTPPKDSAGKGMPASPERPSDVPVGAGQRADADAPAGDGGMHKATDAPAADEAGADADVPASNEACGGVDAPHDYGTQVSLLVTRGSPAASRKTTRTTQSTSDNLIALVAGESLEDQARAPMQTNPDPRKHDKGPTPTAPAPAGQHAQANEKGRTFISRLKNSLRGQRHNAGAEEAGRGQGASYPEGRSRGHGSTASVRGSSAYATKSSQLSHSTPTTPRAGLREEDLDKLRDQRAQQRRAFNSKKKLSERMQKYLEDSVKGGQLEGISNEVIDVDPPPNLEGPSAMGPRRMIDSFLVPSSSRNLSRRSTAASSGTGGEHPLLAQASQVSHNSVATPSNAGSQGFYRQTSRVTLPSPRGVPPSGMSPRAGPPPGMSDTTPASGAPMAQTMSVVMSRVQRQNSANEAKPRSKPEGEEHRSYVVTSGPRQNAYSMQLAASLQKRHAAVQQPSQINNRKVAARKGLFLLSQSGRGQIGGPVRGERDYRQSTVEEEDGHSSHSGRPPSIRSGRATQETHEPQPASQDPTEMVLRGLLTGRMRDESLSLPTEVDAYSLPSCPSDLSDDDENLDKSPPQRGESQLSVMEMESAASGMLLMSSSDIRDRALEVALDVAGHTPRASSPAPSAGSHGRGSTAHSLAANPLHPKEPPCVSRPGGVALTKSVSVSQRERGRDVDTRRTTADGKHYLSVTTSAKEGMPGEPAARDNTQKVSESTATEHYESWLQTRALSAFVDATRQSRVQQERQEDSHESAVENGALVVGVNE